MRLSQFFADQSGAVTVDWVTVTAATVGLGLATAGVVSGGVENLSFEISDQLSSSDWNMFDNGLIPLASFDFTGGNADGWIGGQVMDMGGELGELLVLGPHELTNFLLEVPEGVDQAVMQFDLIAGDSLDASDQWGYDTATIVLNGVPVAIATDSHQTMTFEIPQVDGTTVEATVTVDEVQLGGSSNWTDSSASVTITVDEPTEDIQFQLDSNSNQNINDEFWGIDNFEAATSGAVGF